MGHVSNVNTHPEVAPGQLLNGQRVIQVPGCWRVYAEQPACAAAGDQERGHGQFAVISQFLGEYALQIVLLTSSMVAKQRGGALKAGLGTIWRDRSSKIAIFDAKGRRGGKRKVYAFQRS